MREGDEEAETKTGETKRQGECVREGETKKEEEEERQGVGVREAAQGPEK